MGKFFGIGIFHPKRRINVGTLWRSAHIFGASFVFTVGKRYTYRENGDTTNIRDSLPLWHFDTMVQLTQSQPANVPIIGIENSSAAQQLGDFDHPDRAIYLLGAEDHGLTDEALGFCDVLVNVESFYPWPMNVGVAGSIVCYDRYMSSGTTKKGRTLQK